MSDTTPNLRLPYIMPAQAQKHVTHNEAIRALDAIVQLTVAGRSLSAPPASPADGIRHIVATGASGPWTGKSGSIAAYQDGGWIFYTPAEGWLAWIQDEDLLCAFDGSAWIGAADTAISINPAPLVGVNATADTTNRLSVNSPASLFNHEGGDHRQKINKAAADNTASQLYQSDFSGRAELGLTGDDNFHLKVSADGTAWKDAIVVDRETAAVTFPFSSIGGTPSNPWAGRKWVALGTSITSQAFYTSPLAGLLTATLVNLGVSGGHLSVPATGGSGLEIYDQVANIPADAGLVTLEAGINDFMRASTLGTIADTTTSTFYGALHKAGTDILAADPMRTLVFFTPYSIEAGSTPDWNTANSNGATLAQFQQAVRDVAQRLGCALIDVGGESGISAQTASIFMSDGLHLNTAGGHRFARFAYDRLLTIRPSMDQVSTPEISPAAGTYAGAQTATISCATGGAAIHYTTDGSTPTLASSTYSAPISIAATGTLKAIATKSGMLDSLVAASDFVITAAQVATPAFDPAGGTFGTPQSVAISCATAGATIHYTTNGSTPTGSSPTYSAPIDIGATTVLKAFAVKSGLTDSAVASATYTISAAFSPADLSPSAWWDVSDLSTLWQDTAASSPISADGQTVARIDDKSGHGRNITQATSASRPTYRTDGTKSWLEFDGVDDALSLASTYTTPNGNWAVAYASRKAVADPYHSVVTGLGAGNWIGDRVLDASQPDMQVNDSSTFSGGFALTTALSDHVVVVNAAGGNCAFYQNGTPGSTGSGVTAFATNGMSFTLPQFQYGGRIYELVLIPRALTSDEITSLSNWLKDKVGL